MPDRLIELAIEAFESKKAAIDAEIWLHQPPSGKGHKACPRQVHDDGAQIV